MSSTATGTPAINLTVFRYALMKGLRNPLTLIFNCILPPALLFVRPLWTGESEFFSGFGLLALTIWGGSFLMAQGILADRESGVLTRIMSAPISMRDYLLQNLLAYMLPLAVQVALISMLGAILYSWTFVFAVGIFFALLMFTATSVAMSFAWNCMFRRKESSFVAFSALVSLGSMISGALVPLNALPTALQHVGAIFPAYWAMRSIDYLQQLGTMNLNYWVGIAALLLFTAAFILYGGKRRLA